MCAIFFPLSLEYENVRETFGSIEETAKLNKNKIDDSVF